MNPRSEREQVGGVAAGRDVRETDVRATETRGTEPRESSARVVTGRMPVIVWSTDAALRVASITGAGLSALGLRASELVSVSLREQLSAVDPEGVVLDAHVRALAGDSLQVEARWREREYQLHLEPRHDDAGAIIGVVGVALDVSDRSQQSQDVGVWQAHARHQQRLEAIGTLASGVAHEINNPVQSIMNYAQLIARRSGSSEVATYAQEILHEAQRVASIVKGLLSFARQEGEPYTDVQVSEIVASTLSLVSALLRKEGIQLDVELVDDLPSVRCHPQQIQQVLMNLLGNARDALNERYGAGDSDKRILITGRFRRRDGRRFVRLTVEDHGVGIPEQALEKVFDPFWTSKPQDQAAGLGLSVSQGIVVEHGGAISVESEKNRFTRFHVDLPCASLSVPAPDA
jgi:signal transduction histidine kinase